MCRGRPLTSGNFIDDTTQTDHNVHVQYITLVIRKLLLRNKNQYIYVLFNFWIVQAVAKYVQTFVTSVRRFLFGSCIKVWDCEKWSYYRGGVTRKVVSIGGSAILPL